MDKYNDNRGTLLFPIKQNYNFCQCTVSINHKNVFRGIHANPFDKLVTCIKGKILDIMIDLDIHSKDYLIPKYNILDSSTDNFQLLIPKDIGHAFLAMEEESIIVYHFDGIFTDENTIHIHYKDPLLHIELPVEPILSEKDNLPHFLKPIDYIVFGHKGFLGKHIVNVLDNKKKVFITSDLRLEDIYGIDKALTFYKPKYVINCAGLTGTPNIFWCEDHKIETIETNILYQLTLAKLCREKKIHLTIFGSGGIFKNDRFYQETEKGNDDSTFYSKCRIDLENMIQHYNVLYLRINYPISNLASDKNLLTKLLTYKKINDVEFSITYIDELFPILIDMIENDERGICNFVNEGVISPVKIMEIYNKYIHHDFEILKIEPDRSYAKLDTGKLCKYNISTIGDAIEKCICEYNKNIKYVIDRTYL
jgi:3,5-epimerase/4-reductase